MTDPAIDRGLATAKFGIALRCLRPHPGYVSRRRIPPCRRRYNFAPTSVPPPDRFSVPLWTLTVPLLLNVVLIVEVTALPLLVKVPRLFTNAVLPVVGATSEGGGRCSTHCSSSDR